MCSRMNVLSLVEAVVAPGFNPLNLLLFHNFVFVAEPVQDSPCALYPPRKGGCRGSAGTGRERDAEGTRLCPFSSVRCVTEL